MRIIFHIDMNAFYANCEISQHPELKGKPIVISRAQYRRTEDRCGRLYH